MNLQCESDAGFGTRVENGRPACREVGEAFVDHRSRYWGEGVQQVPDGAAGEPVQDGHTEPGGGASGLDHLLSRPGADTFRTSVAPHVVGEDGPVALVDAVAYRLTDQVAGDGLYVQPMR